MFKLKKNVAISESGFLFVPSTGDSFSVNPVGITIIHELQKGSAEDSILTAIAEVYEVDRNIAEKDMYDFLHKLKQLNLIENDSED